LAAAERGALKLPILDRGAVLALFVAFPAGFICGFCTAPILYLAAYKDQWTNSSAMLAGGAIRKAGGDPAVKPQQREKTPIADKPVTLRPDAESVATKLRRALAVRLAKRRRRAKIERPPWDDQAP
jgi:hypothetical protein